MWVQLNFHGRMESGRSPLRVAEGPHAPPGLAFAALSDKAWQFVERSTLPRFYFDFKKELKNLTKNQSAYTPPSPWSWDWPNPAVDPEGRAGKHLRPPLSPGESHPGRHDRPGPQALCAQGLLGRGHRGYGSAGIDGQKVVKILREKHNLTIAGARIRPRERSSAWPTWGTSTSPTSSPASPQWNDLEGPRL